MRAVRQVEYGGPECLSPCQLERPRAGEGEVLVRVRAAALHPADVFGMRGSPFVMRMTTGLRAPKVGIPGFDLAGVVEAVGSGVTDFAPGDEVLGTSEHTCAEFARARADQLVIKDPALSFAQAAALPTSGLAALHGLRDAGQLVAGHKLLINGAAGGVGSFAVQLGKAMGAEVTGVCSTAKVDFVRGLGADHVVDYSREDFADGRRKYDLIFDNVENRSLSECRAALAEGGRLVLNSGTGATGFKLLVRLVKPLLYSPFSAHSMRRYLSVANARDLRELADMVVDGRLVPAISARYRLEQVSQALAELETGRVRGKLVVELE